MQTLLEVKKKKMPLGWVVNGGRRHAEQQDELILRDYLGSG
jgi:hypothetical protein